MSYKVNIRTVPRLVAREWSNRTGLFYRVRVGKFSTEADAEDLLSRLLKEHFSAFVTAE